jgi:hypothetical protein
MAAQQGCNEQTGELYYGLYGESLGDARLPLAVVFRILRCLYSRFLKDAEERMGRDYAHPSIFVQFKQI